MYTESQLITGLKNMNIPRDGVLLVHSSMKSIGEVEGGADTVLDALSEYMKYGLLILPTHSWDVIGYKKSVFDSRCEPACVGLLPNLFLKRDNVVRSLHPTHSVAALGKNAREFVGGEEKHTTPCPKDGCWGKLYNLNAEIMFLGCSMKSNTFLHGVEEWNKIPDRISEWTQRIGIVASDGSEYTVDMHRHNCSLPVDPSERYDKMQPVFDALGAIRYGKFGDAECIVGNARQMADITSDILKSIPQLFADDIPVPAELYK